MICFGNKECSVYLSDCKVNNRDVSNYKYGSDKTPKVYNVWDSVIYNSAVYSWCSTSYTVSNVKQLVDVRKANYEPNYEYRYLTQKFKDNSSSIWLVNLDGRLQGNNVSAKFKVRPVILLP